MPKLLIMADDLTGAMDTGAQFAKLEIPTCVNVNLEFVSEPFDANFPVAVVNTESRHIAPVEAAHRVSRAALAGIRAGAEFFYKKIDSTFRGNVGAELEALLTNSQGTKLAFIPAFPKAQRTTRDGMQYFQGKPIHESSFGRDLLNPMRDSYIPTLLRQQTALPIVLISRSRLLSRDLPDERAIYVFDAENDVDLRNIGHQLQQHDLLRVIAGSAGFAEHLAHLIPFEKRPPAPVPFSKQLLVLNGSINPVSLDQAEHAEKNGFEIVALTPEILAPHNAVELPMAQEIVQSVSAMLARQIPVVLQSLRRSEEFDAYRAFGDASGLSAKVLTKRVADNLASLTLKIVEQTRLKQLVVFGGDTLMAVARARHWRALLPRNEILPSLVASVVADDESFVVMAKSGGFGDRQVLEELHQFLTNQ